MPDEDVQGLLRRTLELAEDTNRVVHSMRRRAFLGSLFTIFLWLVFIIIPAVAFYYYAAPYIDQMQSFIKSAQEMQTQFKGADSTAFWQNLYQQYISSKAK